MKLTTKRVFGQAFTGPTFGGPRTVRVPALKDTVTIVDGVSFDTVAREWRCKWDAENDKSSLVELQKVLDKFLPEIKEVDGVTNVERIVCGGCLDFKVITSLSEDKFGDWEGKDFAPESAFVEEMKAIDGVTLVETQSKLVQNHIYDDDEQFPRCSCFCSICFVPFSLIFFLSSVHQDARLNKTQPLVTQQPRIPLPNSIGETHQSLNSTLYILELGKIYSCVASMKRVGQMPRLDTFGARIVLCCDFQLCHRNTIHTSCLHQNPTSRSTAQQVAVFE